MYNHHQSVFKGCRNGDEFRFRMEKMSVQQIIAAWQQNDIPPRYYSAVAKHLGHVGKGDDDVADTLVEALTWIDHTSFRGHRIAIQDALCSVAVTGDRRIIDAVGDLMQDSREAVVLGAASVLRKLAEEYDPIADTARTVLDEVPTTRDVADASQGLALTNHRSVNDKTAPIASTVRSADKAPGLQNSTRMDTKKARCYGASGVPSCFEKHEAYAPVVTSRNRPMFKTRFASHGSEGGQAVTLVNHTCKQGHTLAPLCFAPIAGNERQPEPSRLSTQKADILIGKAMNAKIEKGSVDRILIGMRKVLRGSMMQAPEVLKQQFEAIRVPVDALRYTQKSCRAVFTDGRPLKKMAHDIATGLEVPTSSWWVLRVMKRNGLLFSLDNRRLWALKEAQKQIRINDSDKQIFAKAQLYIWDPAFDVFLRHVDHSCSVADGVDIRVRAVKRFTCLSDCG